MMLELLPGHPSAKVLRLPRKAAQMPRRLWGSKRRDASVDTWPVE